MNGDPLPDKDHISRYCSPRQVENGLPLAAAFEMRSATEEYLSVNWLEYWKTSDRQNALVHVRAELELKVKKAGRFAVLNVGEVKASIESITRRSATVTHEPTSKMESHAGVFGFDHSDLAVSVELARRVTSSDVFPAIADAD